MGERRWNARKFGVSLDFEVAGRLLVTIVLGGDTFEENSSVCHVNNGVDLISLEFKGGDDLVVDEVAVAGGEQSQLVKEVAGEEIE